MGAFVGVVKSKRWPSVLLDVQSLKKKKEEKKKKIKNIHEQVINIINVRLTSSSQNK